MRSLFGHYHLDDECWEATGKTAIALHFHTGLRVSELRPAKVGDLDLTRELIVVSSPKGMGRWANGTESSPIMSGVESLLRNHLRIRECAIVRSGAKPADVEPLFPYITKRGRIGYWSQVMWGRLKRQMELATGVRFRWKDFRPTYAQRLKDLGAPIEAVSKCLRHKDTGTAEEYYGRIRSETAFS